MAVKIREKFVKQELAKYKIDELAKETGFTKKEWLQVITPYGFVFGFFKMLSKGKNTLSVLANNICQIEGKAVSRQAVDAKFYARHVSFAKGLLDRVLNSNVKGVFKSHKQLFSSFGRVLLVDSTCIALNRQLYKWFKGSYSKNGDAATLKLQTTYDIKAEDIDDVEVQSFRDNDQKYSGDILDKAIAGDLILRDLGYFSLKVFSKMIALGIYFVSRIRLDVVIMDEQTGEDLDLLELLRQSGQVLDKRVLIGRQGKVPVRLVAQALPEKKAEQKREKARNDRNKKTNHSEQYMELLGWTILVTNVDASIWSVLQLMRVYNLRWRIEILFKAWKSCLNIDEILAVKMNYGRFMITTYLSLVYIILFCHPTYKEVVLHLGEYNNKKGSKSPKYISAQQYYDWFNRNFENIICNSTFDKFLTLFWDEIIRYCSTSTQKSRKSYFENLYDDAFN